MTEEVQPLKSVFIITLGGIFALSSKSDSQLPPVKKSHPTETIRAPVTSEKPLLESLMILNVDLANDLFELLVALESHDTVLEGILLGIIVLLSGLSDFCLAVSLPKQYCAAQSGHASNHEDCGGARKVIITEVIEPATLLIGPGHHYRIQH